MLSPEPDQLTVAEACELLHRAPRTLKRWVQQGRLRGVPHPLDRRYRLLSRRQVEELARQLPDWRFWHQPGREPGLLPDGLPN